MATATRYAESEGVYIAYDVSGQSGPDLLAAPGFISHLEHTWEEPTFARFNHALAGFSRLIRFDKRGTGLSDRSVGVPHLDQRMDDIRAVLDAAGSKRSFLMGISEGGPMCIMFAATYPDRVAGLILFGTYARAVGASAAQDDIAAAERAIRANWGQGKAVAGFAPSRAGDPNYVEWFAKFERLGASPSEVINLQRMNREIDVRHVLPTVRVPTLVLHRRDDVRVRASAGRELAAQIPGSRYVELPGSDHMPWTSDQDAVVREIRSFMGIMPGAVAADRVLATVLFTDIVDSTVKAAAAGDESWHSTLEAHYTVIRSQLQRHRGREVKSTGDGVLALFDGPARAVQCAHDIVRAVRVLNIELRAGLHTGEVELFDDDVGGIAVHIAARIARRARPNEVLTSSTVKDLVAGAGISFSEQGPVELKGIAEPMRLYCAIL